jgi:DNA-binding NarL/FixJ family response regulator
MIRVLVADDQELIRAGFRAILESQPDLVVVAEAGNGAEAVEAARRARPDVALMDIRMPVLDGIAATSRITTSGVGTKVLVLTTFDLDGYVYGALRAGASGFLLKNAPRDQLLDAVRIVARGDALFSPTVTRRLVETYVSARAPVSADSQIAALSPRERDVLGQLARGLSNGEIAAAMHLSEATIKTHVAGLLGKLGLRDRAQAIVFAFETGFVRPGTPSG